MEAPFLLVVWWIFHVDRNRIYIWFNLCTKLSALRAENLINSQLLHATLKISKFNWNFIATLVNAIMQMSMKRNFTTIKKINNKIYVAKTFSLVPSWKLNANYSNSRKATQCGIKIVDINLKSENLNFFLHFRDSPTISFHFISQPRCDDF